MTGTASRIGILLGGGVALFFLLGPTWAQQNTIGNGDQVDSAPRKVQPPKDLTKAKAELERAAAELHQLQAQLEMMRATFEQKTAVLKLAQVRLQEAERTAAELKAKQGKMAEDETEARIRYRVVEGGATVEKRLSTMESKLDQVIRELQEIRQTMKKNDLGGPLYSPAK